MPKRNVDRGVATRWLVGAIACVAVWTSGLTFAAGSPEGGGRVIDNLYGTYFTSAQEGWAVGGFGSIFHTQDGAKTWRPQVSNTTEQLFGVSFANAQNGWAVGRVGTVLHTGNGGAKWDRQTTGNDKHLFNVTALDDKRAWAVGDWGAMITTTDGGQTWKDRSLDRDVILYSQSWPDAEHGWTVGEMGAILATADGGQSWQDQPSGIEKTLFGVHFVDAKRGWACGLDGIILHTEDGGSSWQAQRGNLEVGALEQVGVAEALENASLYDIAIDGKLGYAVGDIGSVFISDDGGQSWKRKEVSGETKLGWIRAVSLVSGSTHAMLVGANGLAIHLDGDRVQGSGKN